MKNYEQTLLEMMAVDERIIVMTAENRAAIRNLPNLTPDRFRVGNITWETELDYSMSHRWTIDYEADYQFIAAVYEALYPIDPLFSLEDVLHFTAMHPEVEALNQQYAGVNWYRHHLDELRTVSAAQTRCATEP